MLHTEKLNATGFPLLMLHGWGQSLDSLKPLGSLLTCSSEIHLIDLPGFGLSPPPATTWSSFDYADRLIAYLDAHNIPQADFLGHSFGGKVAMSLAIRYPERIRRLILMAPSGIKRKRTPLGYCRFKSIQWLGKTLKGIDRLTGSHLFNTQFIPRFASADYRQSGEMCSILVRSVNETLEPILGTIKAPTFIFWGEQDQETPLEMAHRLHRLIPSSRLLLLPHKGHQLFQDVGSHLCAYHLIPFLEKP